MFRALVLATLLVGVPYPAAVQATSALHIRIDLVDSDGRAMPVARHALLISGNPASAAPRRILTSPDGTADVRMRPGNYTVESDRPVVFQGKAYQWTQTVDIVSGRDTELDLTAANAEIEVATASTTSDAAVENDPSLLLAQWKDSVVAVWSATARASGFIVDGNGLVATNQQVIGGAKSVEVQLTPTLKVRANVLGSGSDVAVLRIDPTVAASVRAVPLGCTDAAKSSGIDGQEIYTIGAPLRRQKDIAIGTSSDLVLPAGGAGGPVFTAGGRLIGITALLDEEDQHSRGEARVIPVGDVCTAVASLQKQMMETQAPIGTPLPVEPVRSPPEDALKDAAQHRAGSLNPYQMSSTDFEIAFITPVMVYAAQHEPDRRPRRDRGDAESTAAQEQRFFRPLADFSNWSEYVADVPPVLLVRVTPRMVEGFWTKVARGAALTQGVSVPPIKRLKSGFLRMRTFCGEVEITPVHPFKLERRISDRDAIYEGLYAFDPGALGPQCETARLVLYSEHEPEKGDSRVVDPKLLAQIWQDLAPYR